MSAQGHDPAPRPEPRKGEGQPASAAHTVPTPPRLPSIRQRLAGAVLQVALAWGAGAALLVAWAAHHETDLVLDSALQESAEILYGMLSFHTHALPLGQGEAMPAPPHDERLLWQVVDAGDRVLLRSHQAGPQALAASAQAGLHDSANGARVYVLPFSEAGQGARLLVAQPAAGRRAATLAASLVTAAAALVVALLCALWLRARVRRELQPLQRLTQDVQDFHPTERGATLAAPAREELRPIRDAILSLAERLALRVDSERAFTAHAAHALRTPLAGLSAQLAVALREAPDSLQPRIMKARQASQRLQRVVSALLTLFRSTVEPRCQPVDLATLASSLSVDGLTLVVEHPSSVPLAMDPDLLAAALLNLLDNAARHGARQVQLHCSAHHGGSLLRISDDGEGLAPQRLGQLQAALASQRYDAPLGLGLMLADLVVRAHHGRLQLLPSASGFALEFWLPLVGGDNAT